MSTTSDLPSSKALTNNDHLPVGDSPPFNPYIALVTGVFAVSTGAIFAKMALQAPSLVVAAYRVGLASLIILPIALWKSYDELKSLTKKEYGMAFLSGLFLAMHFATWISSLSYTSVANSVVLVNTNPLWVGILMPLIARERVKKIAIIGIILSVIGGFIIGAEDLSTGNNSLFGDGLAIAGSICAAVYILLGRTIRRRLSLLSYIMLCYGSAAVILWIIVLIMRLPFTGFDTHTFTAFWAMALIPQIIGHTSYNWSLKWFAPSTIAVSLLGEPIGASILAYFIFHENMTWMKIIGGVIILFAILLVSFGEKQKNEQTE